MLEEEYNLNYFSEQGFVRNVCSSCGAAFWTRNPDTKVCGDAPCVPYEFIGKPVFKSHSPAEMREAFLTFHEQNGHTRIPRYPVAARWRDDIYLTIASIADFQPFVTSGIVPPPANPLTISQPCIRLNDLDSVGRSGRHMTCFEMMAHHAFNTESNEIYWKDRTVELCDHFLASVGADLGAVTYKEHPWIGGGNAGPSVEVLIGGLEVATLVFMNLGRSRTEKPGIDLNGEMYYPMKNYIVDTGYGLERLVWASKGSPTIYDAVFPEMVSSVMKSAGLDHLLKDKEYTQILALNAKFAGMMDISGSNLFELRRKVASAINVPVERLERMITPVERIYAVIDHTRCLAYMLGDCIVPSNVREGYLARLVIRRTLRMMNDLRMKGNIGDLVEQQMEVIGLDLFEQELPVVREILERETEKYQSTLERGGRIVQRIARSYRQKSQRVPLSEVMTLYDSHGIPPETVRELATREGAVVDLPDNFYSLVADMHSASKPEQGANPLEKYIDMVSGLPPTQKLFYEQPCEMEFEASVLASFEGYVVLDRTLFYPEGGGQPGDTGIFITPDTMIKVSDAVKIGEVILHAVTGGVVKRGERVKGIVDEERRWSLMRHHSATHIILHACKEVLGPHIHQAGAQKGESSSRIDIRHFKHITPDELQKIELAANRMVMEDLPTVINVEERTKAEQKYGFTLYQGGVPPGAQIRVVQVAGDVEACAGTHCARTGEIGFIRLIRVEHIQDGIERIEFAAGTAAINAVHGMDDVLSASTTVFSVQPDKLPVTCERFFSEWKDQKKEIDRLSTRLADLELERFAPDVINDVPVISRRIDLPTAEVLRIANSFAETGGVALIASADTTARIVLVSGNQKVNAGTVVSEVCAVLGGRGGGNQKQAQGGGPETGQLEAALSLGMERIRAALDA